MQDTFKNLTIANNTLVKVNHLSLSSGQEVRHYLKSKISTLIGEKHVILDAGCGSKNRLDCHHRVKSLIGCDIDIEVIQKNKDISAGVVANLENQVFFRESFDLILSYEVIEHIECPEEFIANARSYLKSGGHIFIVTPNKNSLFGVLAFLLPYRVKKTLIKMLGSKLENEVHWYRLNTPTKLASVLTSNGFGNIQITLLNKLPSYPSRKRKALFLYWNLCKLSFFRKYSVGLLCIATKDENNKVDRITRIETQLM